MRRASLWGLLALLALVAGGCWGLKRSFANWEQSSTEAHRDARRAFRADLPDAACLTREMIAQVAAARGWEVREEPEFHWCVRPADVSGWLRVQVEPPLPFSTEDENAAIFAFDGAGCSIAWEYASGEGTSCPDR